MVVLLLLLQQYPPIPHSQQTFSRLPNLSQQQSAKQIPTIIMSNLNEKSEAATTNVLTITRPAATRQHSSQQVDILTTIEDNESSHTLTPTHTNTHDEKATDRETSPFSPFYNPNPTRYSLEAQKSESKQNINVIQSAYDTDVEACLTPQKTQASCSKAGLLKTKGGHNVDCTVWPGQRAMKMKQKAMRRERRRHGVCGCMAGMDKKTRTWIKALIILVVVGAAIGLGIGISRAVGGGIWENKSNSNAPISGS